MDFSGARLTPPSRDVGRPVAALIKLRSSGCGPPAQLIPPGTELQANPAANSTAAALPAVGEAPAHGSLSESPLGKLRAPLASLSVVENSPALAKRKEVPQEPRNVAPMSWSTTQVKATFGLDVPPLSEPLYWSWRHEVSISSLRTSGKLKLSPKIGQSTCTK